MSSRYIVLFEKESCIIRDNRIGMQLMNVQQTRNNIFPLEMPSVGYVNLAVKGDEEIMI